MKYSKTVLTNGLTILEVPSHDAESVVVDFFVKTGSRSETAKENGISHFLEHFLFKGTKKYPTALAITELIDSIGGEMNANTGKEHTQYYIKAKSSHLPLIFEVLTEMLQNPLLDHEELQREKGVIVEEINMYKDLPMVEIDNVLEGAMWPKDRLGQGIAGSKSTVTKFTTGMFKDYMTRHYQMPNMILGVSGKYNRKELKALVKQYWAKWPRKKFQGFQEATDKQGKPRVAIQYKDTQQAHLVLGFKGLNHRDKRNATASILSTILGSGMSSRLFTEVRERRGLAYYVRASSGSYHDTGVFSISSGIQVDKVDEAITVILKELKKISNVLVDPKELNKAKEYIKGKSTLALEDNHTRLDWYLEQIASNQKVQTPQEFFDEIDKISAKQVQKLARELFVLKHLTLAIIGPYKSEKHFSKLLKF
jgi:predicted Zn-dependent peptidase